MNLRRYKDPFIYYYNKDISGIFNSIGEIMKEYCTKGLPYDNTVYMNQYSDFRESEPNNILYFVKNAKFFVKKLNKNKLTITNGILYFRTLYDPTTGFAIWYNERPLEFHYKHIGDRIAKEYFSDICTDRELAKFILSLNEYILY